MMEEFRKQAFINTPKQSHQEAQGYESKERIDKMTPFLQEEAKMYNSESVAIIKEKIGEKNTEGWMRKLQKTVAGSVGITILAVSIAMGVPSAYGGERSKEKTQTEHIEKVPLGENVEKKEIGEDLYKAGIALAEDEWNTMMEQAKSGNFSELSLSTDNLIKYLEMSPFLLKGYLNKWNKYEKEYRDQKMRNELLKKWQEDMTIEGVK